MFTYNVKNFVNLNETKIDVKPITIITGENNTGKSTITRSLYSILSSLHLEHVTDAIDDAFGGINKEMRAINRLFAIDMITQAEYDRQFMHEFQDRIYFLIRDSKKNLKSSSIEELLSSDKPIFDSENLELSFATVKQYMTKLNTLRSTNRKKRTVTLRLQTIEENLSTLKKVDADRKFIYQERIEKKIKDNFYKNFQVESLAECININNKKNFKNAEFEISGIGPIEIHKSEEIEFNLNLSGIQVIQQLNNVIYLDSPIYPRLRDALHSIKSAEGTLKNYPEYVDKLYAYLESKSTDETSFKDIQKFIEKNIGGFLSYENGKYSYKKDSKGHSYPLSITAMGVVNIGIINMLIRNNSIKKGTFLIIDEPESYLHTRWQVLMAEILLKLAEKGVYVVLATHSAELVKAFQIKANNMKEDINDLISVHNMSIDLAVNKNNTLSEKLDQAMYMLSKPFADLVMPKEEFEDRSI